MMNAAPRPSSSQKIDPLLARLRRALAAIADPARAAGMQAYLKSEMPCHGVRLPDVRAVTKELFADLRFETAEAWRDRVLALWRGARFREERFAAIELAMLKSAREHQTFRDALPLYETLIVEGAWWDLVDDLAANGVGRLLMNEPKPMKKAMRAWAKDENMWKRRTAIISQLTFKKNTDLDLLYACIAPSIGSREFFLRKAIGWALRQYARTDPREVARYVREHDAELSGLSKREALKHARA